MKWLSSGRHGGARRRRVALCACAIVLLLAGLAMSAAGAVLAEQATAAPLPTPFDPRGGGSGPGLVGAPFLVALAVVGLGVAAAGATALYVRLARPR